MPIESSQMATAANRNFCTINMRINFNTLRSYYCPELPDLVSSQQVIFGFIIATLVSFLQIMYHHQHESPFETHKKTMLLAIGSLLMYCLLYDVKLRLKVSENHHTGDYVFHISMAFFGALSVACILSIFFPGRLCTLLLFTTVTILYPLSYFPGFLIQTTWNWWQSDTTLLRHQQQQRAVATLLRRQQQQRTSLGSTRFVSVQLPQIAEDDIIDQFNLLPV